MAFDLNNTSKSTKPNTKLDWEALLKKEIHVFSSTFSSKKKENFYIELSVLLEAGIALKEALNLIAQNEKKKKLQLFLEDITNQVVEGANFSDATANSKMFSTYENYAIKIGEETGKLSEIYKELGVFFTRKNEQRRNMIGALMYPIIITFTAVLVVVFMLRFVVPMFQDIFLQNKVELPWITEFIVSCSNFVGNYGWFFVLLVIVLVFLRKLWINKQWYKKYSTKVLSKVPIFGKFIRTVYLAQFSQAMALLIASRVPILRSIQLVREMITYYPLQEGLKKVEESILKGKSLYESMDKIPVFDHKLRSMIKVAEETNETAYIFKRLNKQYHSDLQQKSKMLSTVLEPFIILFVGVIVAVILIAMYLPMFKLSSVLG